MAFEVTANEQIMLFVYSVIFGTVCAVIYDVFRFLRALFKSSEKNKIRNRLYGIAVFIQDILFFFIISLLFCVFLYEYNYGQPRVFILAASLIGFITYMKTIGVLTSSVFGLIAKIIRYIANVLKYKIIRPTFVFFKQMFLKLICVISVMNIKRENKRHYALILKNTEIRL